jgi:hypothetical protein
LSRAFVEHAAIACEQAAPPTAGERLQRSLSDAAGHIAHLEQRPAPRLHHGTDGNYRYEGPVFTALIGQDGSVTFVDRPPVELGPIPIPLSGSFDLNDAIEKQLGKELYPAEKRWFLEHTAELRRSLSDSAQARSLARGALHLRGQLELIAEDGGLPAVRKRELIFELWDDCAPDDVGEQAQRIVEQFIRDRMPSGSALAYDPAELAQLNRRRASPRPFDPYVPADAGAPG